MDGRRALVTGGAGGLGMEVSRLLAREGFLVSLLDRSQDAVERAANTLGIPGPHVAADVSDRGAVEAALARVARAGPVRVVVHAAGIAESRPVLPPDDALWDHTMSVNARGSWIVATACLKSMLEAKEGRIVLVASTAGLRAYRYTAAYCASKHAVVGLVRALAEDLAGTGVTVNAVCPGFMDTPMTDRTVKRIVEATGRSEAQARAAVAKMNPCGRLVRPAEVAEVVLRLVRDGSLHGQAVPIE